MSGYATSGLGRSRRRTVLGDSPRGVREVNDWGKSGGGKLDVRMRIVQYPLAFLARWRGLTANPGLARGARPQRTRRGWM
jgi:hypothetical protein